MQSSQEGRQSQDRDMNIQARNSVSKPRQPRRLAEFELRILENTFLKTKGQPSDENFIELAGKLKNLRMQQIKRWFQSRRKNKPRQTKRGVGVSSYRSASGRPNKNDEIESSDRTTRPKARRKWVKDSSSSPSEIIVDDEEETPRLQDNNISSCSEEAEQDKECEERQIDEREQNNDDGESNSEIIELRIRQNELKMKKAECETQEIEITMQENELKSLLKRKLNELKKRKLLVIAEELKISLNISKIEDQIKVKEKTKDQ